MGDMEKVIEMLGRLDAKFDARFDAMEKDITSLKSDVRRLEERMSGLEEKTSRLEERMSGLEEKTSRLEERMSGLEEKTSRLEERMSRVEEKTSSIEQRINSYDAVEILSALREGQDRISAQIEGMRISTASTESVRNLRSDVAKELHEAAERIEKTA